MTPIFCPSAGSQTLLERNPILLAHRMALTSVISSVARPQTLLERKPILFAPRGSETPVYCHFAGSVTLLEPKLILCSNNALLNYIEIQEITPSLRPTLANARKP